jgi:hypothetical protein
MSAKSIKQSPAAESMIPYICGLSNLILVKHFMHKATIRIRPAPNIEKANPP